MPNTPTFSQRNTGEDHHLRRNIILDLLIRRDPFYLPAARVFSRVEARKLKACVSSLTFANLFYILRKETSAPKAIDILKELRQLVAVLPVDDKVIANALNSPFADFEDAIQYHTALSKGIGTLLTRNIRDYRGAIITVCTAAEFLEGTHASQGNVPVS